MFQLLVSLIVIVCILLILVVLVQNPKGGGLSSSFGGGSDQMIGGVKKTGDFLDKSTWTLVTLLVLLITLANTVVKQPNFSEDEADNSLQTEDPMLPTEDSKDEDPDTQTPIQESDSKKKQ